MQGCGFAHTWSGTVALTGRQGGAWDGGFGSYGRAGGPARHHAPWPSLSRVAGAFVRLLLRLTKVASC